MLKKILLFIFALVILFILSECIAIAPLGEAGSLKKLIAAHGLHKNIQLHISKKKQRLEVICEDKIINDHFYISMTDLDMFSESLKINVSFMSWNSD